MITGNLEYIMCSLPYLSFQDSKDERSKVIGLIEKYVFDPETDQDVISILNDEAAKFLGQSSLRLFRQLNLETIHSEEYRNSSVRVLAAFSNYMFRLKKSVQQIRVARKEGLEASGKNELGIELAPGTPLEQEVQLLKLQWQKLEELSIGHNGDFAALVIYKLQLMLLLRWWSFDNKLGFERFINVTMEDR